MIDYHEIDFAVAWEQRKFGECCTVVRGGSPRPIQKYLTDKPEGIPWIKIGDAEKGSIYINSTEEKIDPSGERASRRVKKGTLLLSNSMSFGHPYITNIEGCVHDGWLVINNNKNLIDRDFLVHLLSTDSMMNQYKSLASGGVVNNLNKNLVENTLLSFPSLPEQKKIGEFLHQVNELITLHQGKSSKTEQDWDGFSAAWEQRKLSSVFSFLSNNTLSRADLNYENGPAKNIHYGDVLIKFQNVLDVQEEEVPFVNQKNFKNKYKQSSLKNGDIILADAAEDETVGKCCEITNLQEDTLLSGLHTIPLRPIEPFASGYLGYYLNSPSFHDQLIPLIQGTKVCSISRSSLLKTFLLYPSSIEEQKRIANFFTSLDKAITLHQRKLFFFQELKQTLLNQMFV